ncbi:tetratricopeptide repeat protein [Chryseobacterium herbae]|uniref:LuxR C-terminal-related transcriptional regulator n=1 Tax=Chryseobacterium herbae TaxID=2976476 RepID=A0ABT2ITG6_9FLAO|nr:LuxR C-terminal-related transcriptional regulator [Chryseobacterium sp. pc1-10]MCT2562126.1 LuxR C-terminal-related transcriptional regulator [Chryseobacterium sp. pc1-10]
MTKYILSFIFFINITVSLIAQSPKENQLNEIIKDISMSSAGDTEIKKLEEIIKTCKNSGYKTCEGLGYLKAALIYFKNNNTAKAVYYTDKIEKEKLITVDTSLEAFFHLKTLQCNIFQSSGEFSAALQILKEIPENEDQYPYFTYCIFLLKGGIYSNIADNNQAIQCYKKAYIISRRCREEKYLKSLDIKRESQIGNSYKATPHLADAFLKTNQIDSAKIYIEEALSDLKKFDDLKDADIKYTTHFYAGSIYMAEGNYAKAQDNYLISKKIIDRYFPIEVMQKEMYSSLLHLYEKTGKSDSVNYYSKKIFEIEESNELKNIAVKKAIDNKSNHIKQELANDHRKLIYILSACLLMCLLLSFLTISLHKKYKSRVLDKKDVPKQMKEIEVQDLKSTKSFDELVMLAKENKPEFLTKFNELYPEFTHRILSVNDKIQNTEIRFCALLYLNFSTKEIAEFTFTSIRTVQTKKYNLRKKLNIASDVDIYFWFRNLY